MRMRSGKRKKSLSPKQHTKIRKNDTLHCDPSKSTSLDYLNSSASLYSFHMDDPDGAYGLINSSLEVPFSRPNSDNDLSSIWTNANSNRMTFENHIRNIVGVPLHTDSRRSLPPNLSAPPVTSNVVFTAPPTVLTTSVASTHSHDTSYANAAYPPPGFPMMIPVAPSTTDVLLRTLIHKLDVGFSSLNKTITSRLAPSAGSVPQPPTIPTTTMSYEPPTVFVPQMDSNQQPSNIPPVDHVTRLESLVCSLTSQVKALSVKVDNLSTHGRSQSPPVAPPFPNSQERSQVQRSPVPLYKTWPDKWRVKYDGDNQRLSIEFFFDQLTSLRELNDVMWNHVIIAFPLFLEGEPLKWFFRYRKQEEEIHWPKLKHDMIAQFRGTESEDGILFKITNRKQGEYETFDQFYNAILDLKDRLTNENMTDERIMGILNNNAKFEIKAIMVSSGKTSLSDFVNKCRAIDRLYHPRLYKEPPTNSKRVSEIASLPKPAPVPPHHVEAFSGRSHVNPQSTANMKCWNCNNIGHSWQICEEPRQLFCYWCGYKNATCKNCPRCMTNFHSGHNIDPTPPDPPALQNVRL